MRSKLVLGIDPGVSGAFVLTDGIELKTWPMPTVEIGKDNLAEFDGVHELLWEVQMSHPQVIIFIERAIPMAMGSKHAFNYGRSFAALEIAIELSKISATYVEPAKWTKEMHEGLSVDLKAKAKSMLAAKRLFPKLVDQLPLNTKGVIKDGPIDALLIAAYGLRKMR